VARWLPMTLNATQMVVKRVWTRNPWVSDLTEVGGGSVPPPPFIGWGQTMGVWWGVILSTAMIALGDHMVCSEE
jgi:hypothetical protein